LSTHVTFGIQRGLKIPFCVKILTTQRDSILFSLQAIMQRLGLNAVYQKFFLVFAYITFCSYQVLQLFFLRAHVTCGT